MYNKNPIFNIFHKIRDTDREEEFDDPFTTFVFLVLFLWLPMQKILNCTYRNS